MNVSSEPVEQAYVVRIAGQARGAQSLQWCSVNYGERAQVHPVLFDLIPGKGMEASNLILAGYVDMVPMGSAVLLPMGVCVTAPYSAGNGVVKIWDGPVFLGTVAYGLSYSARFHEDHSSETAQFSDLASAIYWLRRRQRKALDDRRERSLSLLR